MKELLEQTIVEKHQLMQQQDLLLRIIGEMNFELGLDDPWTFAVEDLGTPAKITIENGEVVVTT